MADVLPLAAASCPNCGSSIPAHEGYLVWCDRCDWNVAPNQEREFPTLIDRINERYGRRYSDDLFKRVIAEPHLKPRASLSKVAAYVIAGIVHSATFLLIGLGIFLLIRFWPNVIAIAGGLLCLGIGWVLRPRFAKPPGNVLPRKDFPKLYGLVDAIARRLGLKHVDGIAIDHEFNASFLRAGLRGKNYITIGLSLYSILTPDEKVALLAREVAHGVNGDFARGTFIGGASAALFQWYVLLRPARLMNPEDGVAGIAMLPLNLVLLGFAHLAMLGEHLLLFLLFRSSQRAEYYADTLAAEVAGASAVMSGLEKTYYAHLYPLGVQRVALRKEGTLFDELRALAGAMPEREIERIRRASRITGSQVDTTHPPTPFRYDLIRQRGHEGKQDLLDESLAAAIDHELEEEYARAHRAAIDEYRSSLYR